MGTLRISPLNNDTAAGLDVDGVHVGGIRQTSKDTFTCDTQGRIDAIEGLAGGSVNQIWEQIKAKVQAGGVTMLQKVTTAEEAKTVRLDVTRHPSGRHTLIRKDPGQSMPFDVQEPAGLLANDDAATFYRAVAAYLSELAHQGTDFEYSDSL